MRKEDLEALLAPILPAGTRIAKAVHLSELWAGYGHIFRIHVEHRLPYPSASSAASTSKALDKTLIVKTIRPPRQERGYDEGHARKMLSYKVEANFYRHYADRVASEECGVPRLFAASSAEGSGQEQGGQTLALEDLSVRFPVLTERRGTLNDAQVSKSLEWLANFHARSWNIESSSSNQFCPPPAEAIAAHWNAGGLWQQGGYHYLATRHAELAAIDPHTDTWGQLGLHAASDLPSCIDWCLNNPTDRQRLSLIHGDVKAANMAFSRDNARMAMYDFQYVGIGLGVQDLAKFLATSIPSRYLDSPQGEMQLLKTYHSFLLQKLPKGAKYELDELVKDWELALVSWVRFLAGWSGGFWGNVDWLQDRVEALLRDPEWVKGVRERWKAATQRSIHTRTE